MIKNLSIHHIAVCTDDIEKTAELYKELGYLVSETVIDVNQHVYVKFCELKGVKIELVGLIDEFPPIANTLAKIGVSTYHICYEVDDMDAVVKQLRSQGYIPVTRRLKSTIDGRDVIFLYHKSNCLIELLNREN